MKALVLNDTRISRHVGCEIVMTQLHKYCLIYGLEVVASVSLDRHFESNVTNHLKKVDVVIINGEGTMHGDSIQAYRILSFARKARLRGVPTVLLNTLWFNNSTLNEFLEDIDLISCRESKSAEQIRSHGFDCIVVPDLSLTFDLDSFVSAPESLVSKNPLVIDNQRWENWIMLGQYAKHFGYPFFTMDSHRSFGSIEGWRRICETLVKGVKKRAFTKNTFYEICKAKFLISGRFHGCCLSILAHRPIIWFQGKTPKTSGLFEDANLGSLAIGGEESTDMSSFLDGLREKTIYIENTLKNRFVLDEYQARCQLFTETARLKTERLFEQIVRL